MDLEVSIGAISIAERGRMPTCRCILNLAGKVCMMRMRLENEVFTACPRYEPAQCCVGQFQLLRNSHQL
jgi:hypothetical protein